MRAYLALGSNLGNRAGFLAAARDRLAAAGVRILRSSEVRETAPIGVRDQPDFLNQVLEVETNLDPDALLDVCQGLERALGRTPAARWGPREIDVDILLYEDRRLGTDRLTIPHPGIGQRRFLLALLSELEPDLRPPGAGWTVSERLRQLP